MNIQPLVLYVDPAWRRPSVQHTPLLYPFWGNPPAGKKPLFRALFERHQFDTRYYNITANASVAEAVLLPYDHNVALRNAPDVIEACIEKASRLGKPLLIDGIGDIEHSISMLNTFVLRYGGYHFSRKQNEIHIPPYADDLLDIYCGGELRIRQKHQKAVIGFAGWTSLTHKQQIRAVIKEAPDRLRGVFDSRYRACKKGVFFRMQAVALIEKSVLIDARVIKRQSYSGHTDTASKHPEELRKEFVNNLLASDYGLDIRGDSNASTRLFEMLSLGCVPIIVDTERNFPFDDVLDYKQFSFTVDFREIHRLPELIAQFHAGLSDEQFGVMQRKAREAYVQYFRVDALMPHIVREFRLRSSR